MNKLKIGARLNLAFGAMLLLLIGIAYIGWSSLASIKARMDVVVNDNNTKIALGNHMLMDLNLIARSARNYIIYTDKAVQAKMQARIEGAAKSFNASSEQLGALVRSAKARELYAEIKTQAPETLRLLNQVVVIVNEGGRDEAPEFLLKSVQAQQDGSFALINSMIDLQEKQNQESIEQMHAEYGFAVKFLLITALAACAAALGLAWSITRSITRPINQAVAIAQTVAGGDLTRQIDVQGKDEVSELLTALKTMTHSLASIVGEVRAGTETIGTASRQIAAGNQDLSSRTEEQASSLEETASSMEELTSTVRQNAENARQANVLANSASEVALRGGSVVHDVVQTMGSINESSKKIVDIIGVIDGIAFQTNILALNAAVEAARAGEQGRGFAVVASEVRTLAQRSASAAKEIKELISDSVEKVGLGAKLVDQAGETMGEIVDSVKRVTDIMSEIALASQEQNAGIEQINQAVTQMDQVTQQNAALVEEAAAAAESMQEQAVNLSQVVGAFRLSAHRDGASIVTRRPAALPFKVAKAVAPKKVTISPRAAAARPVRVAAIAGADWEEF